MIHRVMAIIMFLFIVAGDAYSRGLNADAAALFKKDYPAAAIESVEKTDIDGLYEVVGGGNVFYYYPRTGDILFGEIYTKGGKNLTAERLERRAAAKIKSLPLDKAIKIGSGKNIVIEFTDLDCPFCRKAEGFFKDRRDVTRYVFLFPLQQIHPKSVGKSLEVLCKKGEDRTKAYREAMVGSLDSREPVSCGDHEASALLEEYVKLGNELGVRGTPAFWMNGISVSGADFKKLPELLGEEKNN